MKRPFRLLAAALCVVAMILGTAACVATKSTEDKGTKKGELPKSIEDAGQIVAGFVPNYPPMEFKDPKTNEIKGLDVDLGNAIAKELGVKMKWEETSFAQLSNAVRTDRIDLIHSGMSDLPDRRSTLDFVDYLESGAQFFTSVKLQKREKLSEPADLCGKDVGASRRTSFPDEIAKWSKQNCEAKGEPKIKVTGTEGSADARTQLIQGRVDAAVQGSETISYVFAQDEGKFVTLGEPFTSVHQGIAFAKKDAQLRDAVAQALATLIKNGTYQKILDRWELEDAAVKRVQVNEKPFAVTK